MRLPRLHLTTAALHQSKGHPLDQVICRAPSASTLQPDEHPDGKFNNGLNRTQQAKDDDTPQLRESDRRSQPPPTRHRCPSLPTHPQLLSEHTVFSGGRSTQAVVKDAASSSSSSFSARGTRRERHSGALPLLLAQAAQGGTPITTVAAAEECLLLLLLWQGGGAPPPSGLGRHHP